MLKLLLKFQISEELHGFMIKKQREKEGYMLGYNSALHIY